MIIISFQANILGIVRGTVFMVPCAFAYRTACNFFARLMEFRTEKQAFLKVSLKYLECYTCNAVYGVCRLVLEIFGSSLIVLLYSTWASGGEMQEGKCRKTKCPDYTTPTLSRKFTATPENLTVIFPRSIPRSVWRKFKFQPVTFGSFSPFLTLSLAFALFSYLVLNNSIDLPLTLCGDISNNLRILLSIFFRRMHQDINR